MERLVVSHVARVSRGSWACQAAEERLLVSAWRRWSGAAPKRERVPRGHWDAEANRRAFMLEVESHFGIKEAKDWKRVSYRDVAAFGGAGLLNRYSGSLYKALVDIFPEKALESHECRKMVSQGHWQERRNRRAFMDLVAAVHAVEAPEDWQKVTKKDVLVLGGTGVLGMYQGSVAAALADLYPEADMRPQKCRSMMPQRYWDDSSNRRAFMDQFAATNAIDSPAAWKQVTVNQISEAGGSRLIRRYASLIELLADVYPEHEEVWRTPYVFRGSVPSAYWKEERNVRLFMDEAAPLLGVKQPDDWYRVSREEVKELGGAGLVRGKTMAQVLAMAYPKRIWDTDRCSASSKRSTQRQLAQKLQRLF